MDISTRALAPTQTASCATGLSLPCSSVGGYRAPLCGLAHNQAPLQNNLIPLTGRPRCVVAMPARCPAPGYNFTPLCPTQAGRGLWKWYVVVFVSFLFEPSLIDQQQFTDDSIWTSQIYGSTGTGSLLFIRVLSWLQSLDERAVRRV